MKRFAVVLLACGLSGAPGWIAAPEVRAEETACGDKGQPSCPLQGWMEKHMQEPYDAKDLTKLAHALDQAAGFAPDPKWNEGETGWSKIAKDAAAAAKDGDFKAVRQSCKSCHKAWRKQYKKEHRMRAVPG